MILFQTIYFAVLHNFKIHIKKKITIIQKECELIYAPVINDYKQRLTELKIEERELLTFPQKTIHVKKEKSLYSTICEIQRR